MIASLPSQFRHINLLLKLTRPMDPSQMLDKQFDIIANNIDIPVLIAQNTRKLPLFGMALDHKSRAHLKATHFRDVFLTVAIDHRYCCARLENPVVLAVNGDAHVAGGTVTVATTIEGAPKWFASIL